MLFIILRGFLNELKLVPTCFSIMKMRRWTADKQPAVVRMFRLLCLHFEMLALHCSGYVMEWKFDG